MGSGATNEAARATGGQVSAEDLKAGRSTRSESIPDGPWRDWYEERAAILEFMGNMTRKDAEARALWLTQEAMRKAEMV